MITPPQVAGWSQRGLLPELKCFVPSCPSPFPISRLFFALGVAARMVTNFAPKLCPFVPSVDRSRPEPDKKSLSSGAEEGTERGNSSISLFRPRHPKWDQTNKRGLASP